MSEIELSSAWWTGYASLGGPATIVLEGDGMHRYYVALWTRGVMRREKLSSHHKREGCLRVFNGEL